MIWLAWRQHRTQLTVGAAMLGLVILYMLLTGMQMRATFQTSALAHCLVQNRKACAQLTYTFLKQFGISFQLPVLVTAVLLPLLVGMFLGAPLVSADTEHGVHRVAWMQSVSRIRWVLVKLGMLALPALVGTAAIEGLLYWWIGPLEAAYNGGFQPFSPLFFDLFGLVPVTYTLFALAVGVAAGAVIGRVIPAIAAALAAFIAARLVVDLLLRPHYLPPRTISYPVSYSGQPPWSGGYEVSEKIVDAAGRLVSTFHGFGFPNAVLQADCPHLPTFPSDLDLAACIQHASLRFVADYQPADRYWVFQGIEAALFGLLGLALFALTVWWVRRRIT